MRLIHTSDWHLGRKLKGEDRTPEIDAALDELLNRAKDLKVDAVLVAGDIYDRPNPPAEAEQVAYSFFAKLKEANIPAIIIAGNHDSHLRFDSAAKILPYVGVQALGRPQKAENGGVINIDTSAGKLCIAAMPFASEKRLLKYEDLWSKDDLEQRQYYRDRVKTFLNRLAREFKDDRVNVIMAHMTIEGIQRAHSEVDFCTQDSYVIPGQMLPNVAQYIALGHIHKPQQVSNSVPTYYSGSLIQVDFGEAEEEKGFNLVKVEPGRPAKVEFISIPCQKPLKVIECNEANLEETLAAQREHPGFLKVVVKINTSKIGLAETVRKICPQALIVEPKYPNVEPKKRVELQEDYQFDAVKEFQNYYSHTKGIEEVPTAILEAFKQLHQEMNDAIA